MPGSESLKKGVAVAGTAEQPYQLCVGVGERTERREGDGGRDRK